MHLVSTYVFLTVGIACRTISVGKLYISKLDNHPAYRNLKAFGGRLYMSSAWSAFTYDSVGTFRLNDTKHYLSVNSLGRVILQDTVGVGFTLNSFGGPKKILAYNGAEDFQLCGDSSIGFDSKCKGAHRIIITYEELE
ncbi:hypothetical protein JCM33374_g5311 [Metschnikowia sp. JCM 33374]|nr:hypothetical protein JCM33374_g5311 [Metschnikowia sp. JCM 33374]